MFTLNDPLQCLHGAHLFPWILQHASLIWNFLYKERRVIVAFFFSFSFIAEDATLCSLALEGFACSGELGLEQHFILNSAKLAFSSRPFPHLADAVLIWQESQMIFDAKHKRAHFMHIL